MVSHAWVSLPSRSLAMTGSGGTMKSHAALAGLLLALVSVSGCSLGRQDPTQACIDFEDAWSEWRSSVNESADVSRYVDRLSAIRTSDDELNEALAKSIEKASVLLAEGSYPTWAEWMDTKMEAFNRCAQIRREANKTS